MSTPLRVHLKKYEPTFVYHTLTETGRTRTSSQLLADNLDDALLEVKSDYRCYQHVRWSVSYNNTDQSIGIYVSPFLVHWKWRSQVISWAGHWSHMTWLRRYGKVI